MEVIYADTSVFGGIYDIGFSEGSKKLLASFKKGERKMMISDLVIEELTDARQEIRRQVNTVPERFKIHANHSRKAHMLAARYIEEGVLTARSKDDALHIATATLQSADLIASWNFKHMVNKEKIELFNKINAKCGFRSITIKTPDQIVNP